MHILTFDVEEWYYLFHHPHRYLALREKESSVSLESITRKIFRFLEEKKLKATFFWVGEDAERYPGLVRELKDYGHEIGVHSFSHIKIEPMGKDIFRANLEKAVDIIQDITGQKVTSYRAPFFSLNRKSLWLPEILKGAGIECDSSTVENRRIGGRIVPSAPFIFKNKGIAIKEFPVTSFSVFHFDFKYGGSGYFRITPYKFLDRRFRSSPYVMSYFHPRDFDLSIHKKIYRNPYLKFKYRIGTHRAFQNLNKLSETISWTSLERADRKINWDIAEIIEI